MQYEITITESEMQDIIETQFRRNDIVTYLIGFYQYYIDLAEQYSWSDLDTSEYYFGCAKNFRRTAVKIHDSNRTCDAEINMIFTGEIDITLE